MVQEMRAGIDSNCADTRIFSWICRPSVGAATDAASPQRAVGFTGAADGGESLSTRRRS